MQNKMPIVLNIFDELNQNFHSSIGETYTKQDVIQVWDSVATYIEQHLLSNKGIHIKDLGTFTISEWKLGIGNHKFIHNKQPIFVISEKLIEFYNLKARQIYTSAKVSTQMLNFAAISTTTNKPRAIVADCINEVVQVFTKLLGENQEVDIQFSQLGTLQIRGKFVSMLFDGEFRKRFDSLHKQCGKEGQVCGTRPKDPKL